jgi:spore coat protein I
MEKNNWDIRLGMKIIEDYNKYRTISDSEYKILKIMMSYPEKFWKIINYYYNSNKAWYSEKNEDKLIQFQKQETYRWDFIERM